MVGWLISVAVKEDLGLYAKANDAFIADPLNQKVDFGIDIVGQYGRPEYGLF